MKLIFFAFLIVCTFNSNFAAPNIIEYEVCKDRMETCHLVLKENLCQRSKYYKIYCCYSCGELESKSQGGEVNDIESKVQGSEENDYNFDPNGVKDIESTTQDKEFNPQEDNADKSTTQSDIVDNDNESITLGDEDSESTCEYCENILDEPEFQGGEIIYP